ncbi:MAG: capsular biosynthesis protein [Cytophagaceae bacterium]|nr:capsular biosynthesis protein [Cytophagaceae bacterium]
MHSHVLPGLDDGAATLDDSIRLIEKLASLGFKKLIATPHIMGDFFKNGPENIIPKLEEVRLAMQAKQIPVQLEAAAEYYLDEWFMQRLHKNEKLMSFGNNYVLFETSYINPSVYLSEAIFQLRSMGYIPVLAHPERYLYLHHSFSEYQKIKEQGVLFQLNTNSLSGYYNEGSKKIAEKLIQSKMIEFAGTDCHADKHTHALKKSIDTSYYHKLLDLPLLNHQL